MPQTLTPEWYEMLGADTGEIHAAWLHTIGNLTLTGYNPELGNKAYAEKRMTFALSHFELNRYFGDCERWSLVEIEKRAAALLIDRCINNAIIGAGGECLCLDRRGAPI
jgi:hypothetical protein